MLLKSSLIGFFAALGFATAAHATPLNFELTQFTGASSRVHILVEQQDANTLRFTLTEPVHAGEIQGELRAFYFNVANESILSALSISGSFISATAKSANNVTEVGGSDTTLDGGGGIAHPFDVGIAFGTAGSDGFVYSTVFTIAYAGGLNLDTFFPQTADAQLFGVRLKPFPNGSSSKLVCNAPCGSTSSSGGPDPQQEDVPAPASLMLLGLGLAGLGLRRRWA
ncbi:PEP-CTERM sorting domain-containing protein [Govanella unica]|uniref:PEP-CTERM sorting domain-containing protein n=1 Tax=Govanella unica TaxID=2975056 RepID=A0A9X3Z6E0_9PROT|nr:PEP-CTERM sorting domain-containing protein [Govania unica]MDA5193125.1 PEP-CTERM sorting domain-containing protein [Govania unica]